MRRRFGQKGTIVFLNQMFAPFAGLTYTDSATGLVVQFGGPHSCWCVKCALDVGLLRFS